MSVLTRQERIANEIMSKADANALAEALVNPDSDTRCGLIGMIYRDAVKIANLATYRGIEYWWDKELGYWVELSNKEMNTAAQIVVKKSGLRPADIFKREPRLVKMLCDNVYSKELRPKKGEITFKNVVLDVDSGAVSDRNPSSHSIYSLSYDYDGTAECPLWMKFLEEVLPDYESRAMLQEYFGCIFLDRHRVKLEKMLYLLGSGSNGKSVIFETIEGILGVQNVSHLDLATLAGKGNTEYSIASIDGKMLNYCSDVDKRELVGSKAKGLISGEPAQARLPYGQPFEARNIPIMIANANELPATNDHTHGYFRRMAIIPFDVVIPEARQDKELHRKLEAEYPGILNWIFRGRKRLVDNGFTFTRSPKAEAKLKEYETESNSVLLFLQAERYFARPAWDGMGYSKEPASSLYSLYSQYCLSSGMKPFSSKAFGQKIREKGFMSGRTSGSVMYLVYKYPLIGEYRKKFAAGLGRYGLDEYAVLLGGKDVEENTDFEAKFIPMVDPIGAPMPSGKGRASKAVEKEVFEKEDYDPLRAPKVDSDGDGSEEEDCPY